MPLNPDDWPSVAVFVPTVTEPVAVLRRTLVGCLAQEYPPHRMAIYLLDDGHREAVQALARDYGVRYLARPDHADAKAGNLNWALAHTTSDIVVIFDADMVPKPQAVHDLVRPLVADPGCAFAQAPQAFYNPDLFQHNLGFYDALPNEQEFFMRRLEAARAQFNAALFVGSNAAFRRAALTELGGFPTGTLTEDAATSLLLQARGWRSAFVPAVVAQGLAAESWGEFLRQRDRWCRGNLQVARKWPPWRLPGLTWTQRLIYTAGMLYWYFGVQKMIYLVAPLAFLDAGIWSVHASVWALGAVWVPAYLAQRGAFVRLTQGTRSVWWSHVYEVAQAPALAWSALAETVGLRRRVFHVTANAVQSDRVCIVWSTMTVWYGSFAASVLGVGRAVWQVGRHPTLWSWVIIAGAWTIYNAAAILAAMAVSVDYPRWRASERFWVNRPSTVRHGDQRVSVFMVDLSEGGSRLTGILPWPVGTGVQVLVDDVWIPGVIIRLEEGGTPRVGRVNARGIFGRLTLDVWAIRAVWRDRTGGSVGEHSGDDRGFPALRSAAVRWMLV
ncbi:glycosyl transferase family protein [Sulfobacillus acidophilus TPY]|nr:glycosyl transferase family protein [Sulfobacillus acidophilus TPY]